MIDVPALEARMLSGEPFTYGALCSRLVREKDDDRTIDKTIQRLRRKGLIAFKREGGLVVWRPVEGASR